MSKLIVTDAEGKSREFAIKSTLTIGRNPGNDIQIAEEKASRSHCRVRPTRDAILIEDLESSNGTRVNGRRISSHPLKNGDTITIGKTTIAFSDDKVNKDDTEVLPDEPPPPESTERTVANASSEKPLIAPNRPSRRLLPISSDDLIGVTLGGYKVESRLGQGGMGTVYRARQISMDRDVALKVLRKELAEDRTFVKSFLREARVAGQCTHPSIIEIHDFGEERGVLYFSMELVEGESLNDILKRERKIPVERALSVCASVADALIYAAKMNIVHRDIKPHNIMISLRNEVKLADLGLASRGGQVDREKPNVIQGTPQYMSPEQIRNQNLDGRADIYALGVSLFHMVTGDVPFDNMDKMVTLTRHLTEARPDPREKNPNIPPAVSKLIMRMMAVAPDDRPANAVALLAEIKSIQNNIGPIANLHKDDDSDPHAGALAGVMSVVELSKPQKPKKKGESKSASAARDKHNVHDDDEAEEEVHERPARKIAGPIEVPIAANLRAIVEGVIAGVLVLIAIFVGVRAIFSNEKPRENVAIQNHVEHTPEPEAESPRIKMPLEPVKPTVAVKTPIAAPANVPITPAQTEELNKALADRDRALTSGNYLRARNSIAAFLASNPDGEAGTRARKELADTVAVIESALGTELKAAERDAGLRKYRLAMQRCTGLISADPNGKFGKAAREILTQMDESTKSQFTEFQAKATEQTKAGQLEKASDTLLKALDELGGTKWAAQVSNDQLQILMAGSLLKQLEAERAKKASENTPVMIKLASKKLEGKLVRVNGYSLEIEGEGISLAVKLRDIDPAEFVRLLQKFKLDDRHLALAYLWMLLDRKDAAQAEVERALDDPEQASAAARLANSFGSALNLHVYDFSRWQQQGDWEAVSGSWSTQNDRYVLDSSEGGDTTLKAEALGGPFPANNARISFDFETIKPSPGYFFSFEFGDEQHALSAIFSETGLVLNSNLSGAMSDKAPWKPGASHVELSVSGDNLTVNINGKLAKKLTIAGLSDLKGTLTFRARETACAIDNVILRNTAK